MTRLQCHVTLFYSIWLFRVFLISFTYCRNSCFKRNIENFEFVCRWKMLMCFFFFFFFWIIQTTIIKRIFCSMFNGSSAKTKKSHIFSALIVFIKCTSHVTEPVAVTSCSNVQLATTQQFSLFMYSRTLAKVLYFISINVSLVCTPTL